MTPAQARSVLNSYPGGDFILPGRFGADVRASAVLKIENGALVVSRADGLEPFRLPLKGMRIETLGDDDLQYRLIVDDYDFMNAGTRGASPYYAKLGEALSVLKEEDRRGPETVLPPAEAPKAEAAPDAAQNSWWK